MGSGTELSQFLRIFLPTFTFQQAYTFFFVIVFDFFKLLVVERPHLDSYL